MANINTTGFAGAIKTAYENRLLTRAVARESMGAVGELGAPGESWVPEYTGMYSPTYCCSSDSAPEPYIPIKFIPVECSYCGNESGLTNTFGCCISCGAPLPKRRNK